jgi:polyhydroxyalkanoate synthase
MPITPEPTTTHGLSQDRLLHANLGRYTLGVSPAALALALAFQDWLTHLALAPGKQQELVDKALRKLHRLALYTAHAARGRCPACIEPLPQDTRFKHTDWQRWPFNWHYQAFLFYQQWWYNATTEVHGVSPHHEQVMTFVMRQLLDMIAPSNFVATNPEVLAETVRTGGANLLQGFQNWWDSTERLGGGRPPAGVEAYTPGRDVAVTPGKVMFRNRLIELIQYAPAAKTVHSEPVLIVPSWIMKYYILDLTPQNSLVRYLVGQGHTVFMISWKNPDEADRGLGMHDYLSRGVMDAIKAGSEITKARGIHAAGYCLGGTLLTIAAAAMARDEDARLKTLTLFASELDFKEPGELSRFIDESQVAWLEDMMWDRGYLDGRQMAGAFTLLNFKDLVWSRMVHDYLMGKRRPLNDLLAWNADATRLLARMHSEYLRRLYLRNDLAEGRYKVDGRPVALSDIRVPVFAVATQHDHVSPWRSVYKTHLLTDTEVTFLLTSGGHNAGIVSEPGHANRSYQMATRMSNQRYLDPETWAAATPLQEGSWWPEWQRWLAAHSEKRVAPPAMGAPARGYLPLADAPGEYVLAV